MSKQPVKSGPVSAGRLKSFVERIERLREEKKAISQDERDVFSEAKGVGYDAPTIRWLLKEREVDAADRAERDTLRDVYARALGEAVHLVRVEGLSLRQAEAATGASKSSIQRALAVPALSREMTAEDLGDWQPPRDAEESSGPCPVSPADGAGKESVLQSAKGTAEDSPPHGPTDELDRAAARFMDQSGGEITVKVEASPGSVFDRLGEALERVAPGRVERTVVAAEDDLTIPHFLRRVPA